MGEIRKDNLHESLIEELNELGNIDLSGKQDKTDESLLTESKDVIGAINELFQNANNGKELIANAIGEPLNSEDTFSAMSNDINSLLSTFKTNMMNNGVTVESNDRFKTLIDKIATMVEEGSGKGVQIASGEINSLSNNTYTTFDGLYSGYVYGSGWNRCNYIELSLNFTPTIILVQSTITTSGSSSFTIYSTTTYDNFSKNGIVSKAEFTCSATANNDGSLLHFSPKNENGKYILPVRAYNTNYPIGTIQCTWLAIGVGEEDTTLRDSLASILQEEGVSVTEEDNMASLIAKVDEEFDRKNEEIENNKGLDIISATELPATGKENQICVITDNPVDNFVITPYDTVSNDSSIITLYTSSAADGDTVIPITSGNITNYYHVYKIRQNAIPLSSYYYNNGWIKLTSGEFIILDSYGMYNDTPFGTITNNGALFQQGYGYKLEVSSSYDSYLIQTQTVDLTNYSKIKVIISEPSDETSYFGAKNHYLGLANSNKVYPLSGYGRSFSGKGTYEVDITNYTGLGSVIVAVWNSGSGDYSCFNVSLITIE